MVIPILTEPEKAITVHSGVDLSRYKGLVRKGVLRKELGLEEGQKLIGVVAALAPHKDLFTFIETCSALKREGLDARYVIIGEGDLRKQLEAYAKEIGVKDELTFLGFRKERLEPDSRLGCFPNHQQDRRSGHQHHRCHGLRGSSGGHSRWRYS